jgi:hypothetical protein
MTCSAIGFSLQLGGEDGQRQLLDLGCANWLISLAQSYGYLLV